MRERPDIGGGEPGGGTEARRKRLDLSVPQVAGSAVAAVVAAKLASYFGVYGTILGAGVVSVIATSGGSVFQHFFKRTGEQIRVVRVQPRPASGAQARRTPAVAPGEFTEGTVHRARARGWRRPLVATALVFGVTMTGITTYELVAGRSFSGDGAGTTVGDAFTGHRPDSGGSGPTPSRQSPPSRTPDAPRTTAPSGGSDGGAPRVQGDDGAPAPAPTPGGDASTDPGPGDGTPTPDPGTTATSPAPSADSRSRSADPDPADPATP